MDIEQKVILITGASSGIGEAAARACASAGGIVVLAARRAEQLAALAQQIEQAGGQSLAVPTDVRDRAAIDALVEATIARYGRIDVLVNNAGVSGGQPITSGGDGPLAALVEINLLGPARLIQAVVPHMRRQGGGIIINIGSVAGEVATPGMYSATKFGLRGLSDALRREVRGEGIAVVHIAPGFIRTPMTAGVRVPMPGPEVVGAAIVRAIRAPRRRVFVPGYYMAAAYLGKLIPALADRLLGSQRAKRRYQERESRLS